MGLYLEQLNTLWGEPVFRGKPDLSIPIGPVCTDSRMIRKGSFYFPLIGRRFDGHKFLSEVIEKGAQAAVISRDFKNEVPDEFLHWVVDDTLLAYQQLALLHRSDLAIPVIAVTGSVGKTTTKELLKGVLEPLGSVIATYGNNNNDVGVPLTLLQASDKDSAIILEMGMRGFGEIKRLSFCSNPDIAVITNIGNSHIGRLGSRRNIALAKCEITSYLNPSGVVVIPSNDELLEKVLQTVWKGKVIRVDTSFQIPSTNGSSNNGPPFRDSIVDLVGCFDVKKNLIIVNDICFQLPFEGKHNAMNFMLALAVAKELGVDLTKITNLNIQALQGRNSSFKASGITILDQTYNSSPESVKASLELLVNQEGRHFAVLGLMLELGHHSSLLHTKIGDLVKELSLDGLIVVGKGSDAKAMTLAAKDLPFVQVVDTAEEAFNPLISWIKPGDIVLLKGSHSIGLERLFTLLKNHLE